MKEALNFMKDYKNRKNALISTLILIFIGIIMMLFDYFVYGENFWNSTTYNLLFGGIFALHLYKICFKKDKK